MAEPVSVAIFIVAAGAIATARPKWEAYQPTTTVLSSVDRQASTPITLFAPEAICQSTVTTITKFSQDQHPSRTERLLRELYRYASLRDGWDGDGSKAPQYRHVSAANQLIRELPDHLKPAPMISHDGTLGLYWDTRSTYADLEFEDASHASLYVRDKTGSRPDHYEEHLNLAELGTVALAAFLSPLSDPHGVSL